MPQPRHHELTHRWSRRRTLVALGSTGILGAVAGCLDGGSDSDGGSTGDSSVSGEALTVTRTARGIEVAASNSTIQAVNLIGPSGDALGHQSIPAGASTVSFQLLSRQGSGYETGVYTIVGVNNGESVAETTVNLNPAVGINAVFRGEERPELDWRNQEESDLWKNKLGVELKNTGTGPEQVLGMTVAQSPNSPFSQSDTSFSLGKFIAPGETSIVKQEPMTTPVFRAAETRRCQNRAPAIQETEVTIDCKVGNNPTWTQEYRYTERENGYGCEYEPVGE